MSGLFLRSINARSHWHVRFRSAEICDPGPIGQKRSTPVPGCAGVGCIRAMTLSRWTIGGESVGALRGAGPAHVTHPFAQSARLSCRKLELRRSIRRTAAGFLSAWRRVPPSGDWLRRFPAARPKRRERGVVAASRFGRLSPTPAFRVPDARSARRRLSYGGSCSTSRSSGSTANSTPKSSATRSTASSSATGTSAAFRRSRSIRSPRRSALSKSGAFPSFRWTRFWSTWTRCAKQGCGSK